MNGPAHYDRAETMLEEAERNRSQHGEIPDRYTPLLAAAQVHATLALAAATAIGTAGADGRAWAEAAGTTLSGEA